MKIPLNKSQVPFTKETLMDRLKFLEFCRKQGLNVSMSELKWLYENKILFPAVRVIAGCLAIRKFKDDSKKYYHADDVEKNSDLEKLVEKEVYYKPALVVRSGNDWIDWYEKRNMCFFPSQEKETAWITQESGIFSKMEDVPDNSELFYDKDQFIALKLVYHRLRITTGFSPDKKKMWQEHARKEIEDFYKCLRFYPKIQQLKQELEKDSDSAFKKLLKDYDDREPDAKKDFKIYQKNIQIKKFREQAKQIIESSKHESKDIERWLKIISAKSFLRDIPYPFEFIKRYIQSISEKILHEEYINAFAEDILWFRNLMEEKTLSFKEYLYSSFDRTTCYVCGTEIPLGRKTCGETECKKEYNRILRQSKRKVDPEYGQ